MTEAAAHIRRLFLDPKDTYSPAEAAAILGMEPVDLKSRMESGEVEGVRKCCGITVSRKELISFAMDYWPQDAIEERSATTSRKPSRNFCASPICTYASPASKSSPSNTSRTATASPSTPSSRASCATLSPQSLISSPCESPASQLLFGDSPWMSAIPQRDASRRIRPKSSCAIRQDAQFEPRTARLT